MTQTPHLSLPLRLNRTGGFATVEQDSLEEVGQCVEVLLSTVEGERLELPDYGIPDLAFSVDLPLSTVEQKIAEWEPRAVAAIEESYDLLDEAARNVNVRIVGGEE